MTVWKLGKQVTVAINRGDLTGSSFAFTVEEQAFREMENRIIREIASVRLFDVGPVTFPAYQATSTEVAKRTLSQWREAATRKRLRRAKRMLFPAMLR